MSQNLFSLLWNFTAPDGNHSPRAVFGILCIRCKVL
jgi:hypothetical protein